MVGRLAVGGLALLLAAASGPARAQPAAEAPPAPAPPAGDDVVPKLPVPPVPPRIAQGDRYEACLNMLDNDPAGASDTASAWQAEGGGDGALHCLALAEIELGNPEIGAGMLDQLAATSQAPALVRASVYGQAVQAWLMANHAKRAFASATHALELSPDDPDLLIDRAVTAGATDRYADAIADLDRALAIDPRRVDALVLRGSAWRHQGGIDRAQDDIEQALTIDPDNADALLERGILRQRGGDAPGARADWERAMRLDPNGPDGDLAQQNLSLLEAGPAPR